MKTEIIERPTSAGNSAEIVDKRGYAKRWGLSTRTIDNLLRSGLPHCKVGKRRVRLFVAEADAWMRERFLTQRRAA
jgi:hypothetical protein